MGKSTHCWCLTICLPVHCTCVVFSYNSSRLKVLHDSQEQEKRGLELWQIWTELTTVQNMQYQIYRTISFDVEPHVLKAWGETTRLKYNIFCCPCCCEVEVFCELLPSTGHCHGEQLLQECKESRAELKADKQCVGEVVLPTSTWTALWSYVIIISVKTTDNQHTVKEHCGPP